MDRLRQNCVIVSQCLLFQDNLHYCVIVSQCLLFQGNLYYGQAFSALCAALPRGLVREGLVGLVGWTFGGEGSSYIACNERQAFFASGDTKRYKLWSCQNVCEALVYLLDNIYIRFGTGLYRQIVGVPMGAGCAPLVAGLFLFCYGGIS